MYMGRLKMQLQPVWAGEQGHDVNLGNLSCSLSNVNS